MLNTCGNSRVRFERCSTGKQFVKHDTEAVQITASIDLVTIDLLRTHVFRCTQHGTMLRHFGLRIRCACDAKISQHGLVVLKQDVVGLNIAMHKSRLMCVAKCGGDLFNHLQCLTQRKFCRSLPQCAAFDIGHGEQIPLLLRQWRQLVYRHNVRVIQLCQYAGLAQKATIRITTRTRHGNRIIKYFNRDPTVQLILHSQVNNTTGAVTEFPDDRVVGVVKSHNLSVVPCGYCSKRDGKISGRCSHTAVR